MVTRVESSQSDRAWTGLLIDNRSAIGREPLVVPGAGAGDTPDDHNFIYTYHNTREFEVAELLLL